MSLRSHIYVRCIRIMPSDRTLSKKCLELEHKIWNFFENLFHLDHFRLFLFEKNLLFLVWPHLTSLNQWWATLTVIISRVKNFQFSHVVRKFHQTNLMSHCFWLIFYESQIDFAWYLWQYTREHTIRQYESLLVTCQIEFEILKFSRLHYSRIGTFTNFKPLLVIFMSHSSIVSESR